jgi:hypothetical protein
MMAMNVNDLIITCETLADFDRVRGRVQELSGQVNRQAAGSIWDRSNEKDGSASRIEVPLLSRRSTEGLMPNKANLQFFFARQKVLTVADLCIAKARLPRQDSVSGGGKAKNVEYFVQVLRRRPDVIGGTSGPRRR